MKFSRREVLKMTAAAGASAAVPAQVARAATAPVSTRSSQPNILLIMSDQHRGDCIGADGNPAIHTPNLDEIAHGGALFRQAYTATPSCTPARAALLTGLGPWSNGLLGMDGWPIAPSYPTELPRTLKNAGYHTVGIGKMEFGPIRSTDHGFDEMILDETSRTFRDDYVSWFLSQAPNLNPFDLGLNWNAFGAKPYPFPERLHHTHWTGQTAVNFLRTYQGQKPFFLKVSFIPPHSPYMPPDRFLKQYADANLPAAYTGNWDSRYKSRSGPGTDIWHGDLGAKQVHESRSGYYGSVAFVDDQIGHILQALDQRGWSDETLILYTTDHGDMLGDHYLWRKCQPYQSDVRIPMLIRWPKGMASSRRGQVISEVVELRDVLPTLADAAGASLGGKVDGQSMLRLIRGNTEDWRKTLELEHDVCYSPTVHWNALTDGRVKYIFHADHGWEQLFDIERDPHETTDLALDSANAGLLKTWRDRLTEQLAPRGPEYVKNGKLVLRPKPMPISPNYPKQEVVEFLKKYGIQKYRYSVPAKEFPREM